MTTNNRCGQWDNEHRRCVSGHIRISPTCWGATNSRVVPQCLTDDPPPHLIRDDGMPLGWPVKRLESHDATAALAAHRKQGGE